MDIGRRPYKTSCRFLEDNGTVSTIRWVEARADAPTISGWSGIVSLDMCNDAWADWPLGEVRGAPRTFIEDRAPVGFDGSHQCATAHQLEFGGKYLPDLPPAEYDDQGYLVCCEVPPIPPPIPVPGPTCETALPVASNTDYSNALDTPGVEQWWKFTVSHGNTSCIFTGSGAMVDSTQVVYYPDVIGGCPALGPGHSTVISFALGVLVTSLTMYVMVKLLPGFPGFTYTLRLTELP